MSFLGQSSRSLRTKSALSMRGCIINVSYAEEKNQEAIYRIIAERKGGRFKFSAGLSHREMKAAEIGEFMKLLMDGIRRVDEDNSPEEEEV